MFLCVSTSSITTAAAIYIIAKTRLLKYIENFTSKNWKFSDKKRRYISAHITAQNLDCGYSLEPPRQK